MGHGKEVRKKLSRERLTFCRVVDKGVNNAGDAFAGPSAGGDVRGADWWAERQTREERICVPVQGGSVGHLRKRAQEGHQKRLNSILKNLKYHLDPGRKFKWD